MESTTETTSFSGKDIKVVVGDPPDFVVHAAQSLSYSKYTHEGKILTCGKVTFNIFDALRDGSKKDIVGKKVRILVTRLNAYGEIDSLFDETVRIYHMDSFIDMDKDVTEEVYRF
jgi:hypothetical protein